MVKHKLRITSYGLMALESEFKSTNSNLQVTTSNVRVASSGPRVRSSNALV